MVTSLESPNTSDRNAVAHNVVNSRRDGGIHVKNNANATLVANNTANGSHDDGIHVDAAGTTVTRNTANYNLDLGIESVPGVIDGGSNRATGNGNPDQVSERSLQVGPIASELKGWHSLALQLRRRGG